MTFYPISWPFHLLSGPAQRNLGAIEFLLRDEFITDEAAPIASPRNAEPGPGSLTLVQNSANIAIDDNKLKPEEPTTGQTWTNGQGFYSDDSYARVAGLAFLIETPIPGGRCEFGLSDNQAVRLQGWDDGHEIQKQSSGQMRTAGELSMGSPASSRILSIILKTSGAYYLLDEDIWYIDHDQTFDPLWLHFTSFDASGLEFEYLRLVELPAPFVDETYLLHSDATPTTGDTAEGDQDSFIYFKWTPASAETLNIRFRYVDDDNCIIVRCDQTGSTIKLIERDTAVETELATASQTWTVGTEYQIRIRCKERAAMVWVREFNSAGFLRINENSSVSFQINEDTCKVDGFTSASLWEIEPITLSGNALDVWAARTEPSNAGGQAQQTINVPDGADLDTYIAMMDKGDILSLATNGTYTQGATDRGITGIPSGYANRKTIVRGNNATITGGERGVDLNGQNHWRVENLNLVDQTVRTFVAQNSRYWEVHNVFGQNEVGPGLFDVFRFITCRDGLVTNCEAAPSIGWGAHDGFECSDGCGDTLFENCEAHGVIHGFEVWTGSSPLPWNYNITFRNCNSHDNNVGYSTEGGVQSLGHPQIVADNCSHADNRDYDYQGVEGATLLVANDLAGTENGSVVRI